MEQRAGNTQWQARGDGAQGCLRTQGTLHLGGLAGARMHALSRAFEPETCGPMEIWSTISLRSLRNAAWGKTMGGPAEFRWASLYTDIRVSGHPFDGKMFRLFNESLDSFLLGAEVAYLEVGDEGAPPLLDLDGDGFPPPHLEFRKLGFADVVPQFLRDKILDHIIDRFARGVYNSKETAEKLETLSVTNFKPVLPLRGGAVRYFDVDSNHLGWYALSHG